MTICGDMSQIDLKIKKLDYHSYQESKSKQKDSE